MRRFSSALFLSAVILLLAFSSFAGTYPLADGQTASGDPILFDKTGVVLRGSGGAAPQRFAWEKFTPESLKQLRDEARTPAERAFITPFLQDQTPKKELTIQQPSRVELPRKKAGIFGLFASPLGLTIILILYLGNLFAAYEAAIYRRHAPAMVLGVSAVLPLIGPILFSLLPSKVEANAAAAAPATSPAASAPPLETAPPPASAAAPAAAYAPPPATPVHHGHITSQVVKKVTQMLEPQETPAESAALEAPEIYPRGQFTFNRRFFETRLPGFLKIVPDAPHREIVIHSARGQWTGSRIAKLTPTELHLQISKGNAMAEEIIPYTEIKEVQVRQRSAE